MNSMEKVKLRDTTIEIIDGDRGRNYPSKSDFLPKGFCAFLDASNVTKSGFNFDNPVFITKEKSDLMRNGKLQRGDIVITTRGTIGNIAYFDENIGYENIRINSGMLIVRNSNEIDTKYLYYLLRSDIVGEQIKAKTTGSSQPQITVGILNDLVLLIPPLVVQKQISSVLSLLDDKIELNRKIATELERLARAIYDWYFVQNRKPEWKVEKLGSVCEIVTGKTPSTKNQSFFNDEDYMFITPEDIKDSPIGIVESKRYISEIGLNSIKTNTIAGKSIVVGCIGEVGTVGYVDAKCATNQQINSVTRIKIDYGEEYIYFFLKIHKELLKRNAGTTVLPILPKSVFEKINIPIPDTATLAKFSEAAQPIFARIVQTRRQSADLAKLRDFLLPPLMNGEIEVGSLCQE